MKSAQKMTAAASINDAPIKLWRLRRFPDDHFTDEMSCELVHTPAGVALGVRKGTQIVWTELVQGLGSALTWSEHIRLRLQTRGWHEPE